MGHPKCQWEEFAQKVEEDIPKDYERMSIHKLERNLRKAITNAAIQHIGRKQTTRKDNRKGHSKEVKEAIKERNDLRHKAGEAGGGRYGQENARR